MNRNIRFETTEYTYGYNEGIKIKMEKCAINQIYLLANYLILKMFLIFINLFLIIKVQNCFIRI